MIILTTGFTLLHFCASIYAYWRNPTKADKELVIQHHEKCVMLGLIALAILIRWH